MNRRVLLFTTLGIVIVILAVAALAFRAAPKHGALQSAAQTPTIGKAQAGKLAPNFVVATTSGLFDLSKVRKPVFLEVFATWCPHCQREAAVVDRLYQRYGRRVDFVAVSGSNTAMDGASPSSERDVLDWIRRFNVRYPVAYDPLLAVANLYLQSGFPTIAVIGRDKRVRYLNDGEIAYADLAAVLRRVLRSR